MSGRRLKICLQRTFAGINLIPASVVSGRYLPESLNQTEMIMG
jgi:hypothetical protein